MTSLDGRRFTALGNSASGQVGEGTIFHYHQDGDLVWASFSGGQVRHGDLVGTRTGDELDFRYVHLDTDAVTSSGRCHSRIENGPRLLVHETWQWESKPGAGTSVLAEVTHQA